MCIRIDWAAVEEFHRLALWVIRVPFPLCFPRWKLGMGKHILLMPLRHYRENGAKDNGGPGIREEMSRYPYYAAFAVDMEGNNVEAVCAPREARKE